MITKNEYPRLAFCSSLTPAKIEYYENLRKVGINAVSICMHSSGHEYFKYAVIHTNLARQAGLTTHAYMITDLYDPISDVTTLTKRLAKLGYGATTKVTILVNSDKYVKDRESKIVQIMDLMSNYHDRSCIDLAFFKRDLDDKLYDLDKLPRMINLTIINCTPGASSPGINVAGTWIYKAEFENDVEVLAYDFYGYYTDDGYQLSLVDTEYVAQPGDSWYSISRRHGIPINDLLVLNRAMHTDRIYAGQVVRIA